MDFVVIVRNVHTRVQSEITAAQWKTVRNSPKWRGVFERIMTVRVPPEVLALKAKQAGTKGTE